MRDSSKKDPTLGSCRNETDSYAVLKGKFYTAATKSESKKGDDDDDEGVGIYVPLGDFESSENEMNMIANYLCDFMISQCNENNSELPKQVPRLLLLNIPRLAEDLGLPKEDIEAAINEAYSKIIPSK